jgi:hypothetical protein
MTALKAGASGKKQQYEKKRRNPFKHNKQTQIDSNDLAQDASHPVPVA